MRRPRAVGGDRIRGSTPDRDHAPLHSVGSAVSPVACSLLPGILRRGRKRSEQFRRRLSARSHGLLLGRHGTAAHWAELRVGGERTPALNATDDRRRCRDRAPAVGAKVRAPHERSATGASCCRGCPAYRDRGREQGVDLVQPLVEGEQFVAALDEEVLTELVTAEHLQHEPAEIAEPFLANPQQCPPLLAQLAGMRQRPPRRTGRADARRFPLLLAAEACQQRRPRHADKGNSEV